MRALLARAHGDEIACLTDNSCPAARVFEFLIGVKGSLGCVR